MQSTECVGGLGSSKHSRQHQRDGSGPSILGLDQDNAVLARCHGTFHFPAMPKTRSSHGVNLLKRVSYSCWVIVLCLWWWNMAGWAASRDPSGGGGGGRPSTDKPGGSRQQRLDPLKAARQRSSSCSSSLYQKHLRLRAPPFSVCWIPSPLKLNPEQFQYNTCRAVVMRAYIPIIRSVSESFIENNIVLDFLIINLTILYNFEQWDPNLVT